MPELKRPWMPAPNRFRRRSPADGSWSCFSGGGNRGDHPRGILPRGRRAVFLAKEATRQTIFIRCARSGQRAQALFFTPGKWRRSSFKRFHHPWSEARRTRPAAAKAVRAAKRRKSCSCWWKETVTKDIASKPRREQQDGPRAIARNHHAQS